MQNWLNVVDYVKKQLGYPIAKLEITDDDIIRYIKDHVLPQFSNYVPLKKWYLLTTDKIIEHKPGYPLYRYKMDTSDQIIDVMNVYTSSSYEVDSMLLSYADAISTMITTEFLDILNYLHALQTWQFIAPNILQFSFQLEHPAVVEYATIHSDPSTIRADMYPVFKDLCAGHIMVWIANMRSKFESLTTPFGNLNINWQQLKADGNDLVQRSLQLLDNLPPDFLVAFIEGGNYEW